MKHFIWFWPDASNKSFYDKEVKNMPIDSSTVWFGTIKSPVIAIGKVAFRYEIYVKKIANSDIPKFLLQIVAYRNNYPLSSETLYENFQLSLVQQYAEEHAKSNFVNNQLS